MSFVLRSFHMKVLFGCLLCLAFTISQGFAIGGGPPYGNGGITTTGIDAGIMMPGELSPGVIAAFAWNIITWAVGLPSSSSHALIGGLCGAAIATAHGRWSILKMEQRTVAEVVVPMLTSPVAGFVLGFLVMMTLFFLLHRLAPGVVNSIFGKLQIFSAAWMAHSHGTNDAQKTMGIITLALFTATKSGSFAHLPASLSFLETPTFGGAGVGESSLRDHHGGWNGRGWLADNSHSRPQDGQTSARAWICGRDQRGTDYSNGERVWNPAFHHPRRLDVNHGRGRGQTVQRREMDRGRANCMGLGSNVAGHICDRIRPRADGALGA
jgi:hypothetical protein